MLCYTYLNPQENRVFMPLDDELSEAIDKKQLAIVRELIQARINEHGLLAGSNKPLQASNDKADCKYKGCTPLFCAAAILGDTELCKELVAHGAGTNIVNNEDTNFDDDAGLTPIKGAAKYGHFETLKYLVEDQHCPIEAMITYNNEHKSYKTPASLLYFALKNKSNNQRDIVKYLLNCNADIWYVMNGKTLIYDCAERNNFDAIKLLHEVSVELNKPIDFDTQKPYSDSKGTFQITNTLWTDAFLNNNFELIIFLKSIGFRTFHLPVKQGTFKGFTPIEVYLNSLRKNPLEKYQLAFAEDLMQTLPHIFITPVRGAGTLINFLLRHPGTKPVYMPLFAKHLTPVFKNHFDKIIPSNSFVATLSVLMILPIEDREVIVKSKENFVINLFLNTIKLSVKSLEDEASFKQASSQLRNIRYNNLFRSRVSINLSYLPLETRAKIINQLDNDTLRKLLGRNITLIKQMKLFLPQDYFSKLLDKLGITEEQYFIMDPQSTHQGAVHKSINESAIRLLKRYDSSLPKVDEAIDMISKIFEKHALIPAPKGLGISEEDKSLLKEAIARIKRLKGRIILNTEEKNSQKQITMNIPEALAITIVALTDFSEEANKDKVEKTPENVTARFRFLARQLIESQKEYGNLGPSCFHGTFNKIIETLQGIHADVPFIQSDQLAKEEQTQIFRYTREHFLDFVTLHFFNTTQNTQENILSTWDNMQTDPNCAAALFSQQVKRLINEKYPQLTETNLNTLMENLMYVPLQDLYHQEQLPLEVDSLEPNLASKRDIEHVIDNTTSKAITLEQKRLRKDSKTAEPYRPVPAAASEHGLYADKEKKRKKGAPHLEEKKLQSPKAPKGSE